MAFKGTLDSLSMIEVFQVISMARKAGCLVVQHPSGEAKRLYFDAGDVVTATSNAAKDRLGALLVKMGLLQQEQVDASRAAEQRTGLKQGRALVDDGLLAPEQLTGALTRQITEIFYSVMAWREGTFEFLDQAEPDPDMHLVRESVTNLVMRGTRQLDEWSLIERVFPTMDLVISMCPPKPGTGAIHLQPDEWQILTLIDGRRTIREICSLASDTNFDVCRKLLNLHHAGLVAKGEVRLSAPPPAPTSTPPGRHVPDGFYPTMRAEFTRMVGPIAGILLDEIADALEEPIETLPLHRVPELTKLLCAEIDAPDKRERLQEIIARAAAE